MKHAFKAKFIIFFFFFLYKDLGPLAHSETVDQVNLSY
jgi:hypothetical protein